MKKLIKKITLALILTIFLNSCNEQNELVTDTNSILEKSKIETATLQQKIDYTNYHLLDVGKVVSKLAKNSDFKKILFNSINKKVYEGNQSEIQMRELINNLKSNNSSFLNSEDENRLENAFNSFYDLDGNDWHPAIYIADFENQYQKFLNNESEKSYDSTKPLIVPVVFEDDDETTQDKYAAYQEQDDDDYNLEEMDFEIAESDSEEYNNIIFVKLSEVCDGNQMKCASNGNGGNPSNPTEPNLFLKRMKAKYHKESVGRSEVEVKGKLELITNYYPLTTNTQGSRDIQYSYKRRWIRNHDWKTKNDNFTVYSNQGLVPVNETIYSWVIFEWDPWPAPEKTRTITHTLSNGVIYTRNVSFHSWQGQYDKGAISSFQTNNLWSFNNSSISYEFKKLLTN